MTSIGGVENSDDRPTVRELRRAAHVAAQLDAFLERCNRYGVTDLTGCDLDDLSGRFTAAAERMKVDA